MRTSIQRSVEERGIHAGQHFVLEALWNEDDVTCGELARRLGVALPTVTKAVTRMEAAGFVGRRQNETDARMVHVYLTPHGRELEREIQERLDQVARRTLEGIDPADKKLVIDVLWRVRENLGPGGAQVEPHRAAAAAAMESAPD
jgi:DNA-binding MarR family transcriptional regulator